MKNLTPKHKWLGLVLLLTAVFTAVAVDDVISLNSATTFPVDI